MGIAMLFSKLFADFFIEGLYHALLHVKNIPYIGDHVPHEFENKSVKDIMSHSVVSLKHIATWEECRSALQTTHNCFPVIKEQDGMKKFLGSIRRVVLLKLVRTDSITASDVASEDSVDLQRHINESAVTVQGSFDATRFYNN